MQTSKVALITALVVVLGAALWYFLTPATSAPAAVNEGTPTSQSQTTETQPVAEQTQAPEPSKTASNDEIIDFVVDDLTKEESVGAKTSIDAQTPETQVNQAASLDTNF